MTINRRIFLIIFVTLAATMLTGCDEQVTRQMIPNKDFREWFISRLTAAMIVAGLIGVVVWLVIRQFRVKPPATHSNRQARIVFFSVMGLIALAIPAGLWLEAYSRIPFSIKNISLSNYFFLLVPSYYTAAIIGASWGVFYLVVMILTRFVGGSPDCKFAFLPNLKKSKEIVVGRT